MADLKKMLQKETLLRKAAEGETNNLKNHVAELKQSEVCFWTSNIYVSLAFPLLIVVYELVLHGCVYCDRLQQSQRYQNFIRCWKMRLIRKRNLKAK
jgi:hypothetical protein